jgi:hypothetical protein
MGKKGRRASESEVYKKREGTGSCSVFGITLDSADRGTIQRHLLILVAACILMKFVIVFLTTAVFHSFIDYFDIGTYFNHTLPLLQGQIPYIDYQIEYPVLALLPILIALVPALLTNNVLLFVLSFQFLMLLCDIVTTVCVYLIALKIWDEKRAFLSAGLYVTSFSAAYFVITKYDAFPTCLLMLALLFTLYGMKMNGYLCSGLGFFAKIYPAVAIPFFVLHNSKNTSLKEEIISALKIIIPLCAVLFIPFILFRPEVIKTYLFTTGSSAGVYANTLTYTVYGYLVGIGHLGITIDACSVVMYLIMGIIGIVLFWSAYRDPEKRPVTLIKLIACTLITAVLFTKFHSPQYIVWYTPLLALLAADDLITIILFYVYQALAYIEFPLMFGSFYTNLEYTALVGSATWYGTLFFFTAEFAVFILLTLLVLRPKYGYLEAGKNILGMQKTNE